MALPMSTRTIARLGTPDAVPSTWYSVDDAESAAVGRDACRRGPLPGRRAGGQGRRRGQGAGGRGRGAEPGGNPDPGVRGRQPASGQGGGNLRPDAADEGGQAVAGVHRSGEGGGVAAPDAFADGNLQPL